MYTKGQKIRMTESGNGFRVGDVFTLSRDGEGACFNDNDGDARNRYYGFELVSPATAEAKFKVGDRVVEDKANCTVDVNAHWNQYFRGQYGDIIDGALVVASVSKDLIGLSNKVGRAHFYVGPSGLIPATPALTITAGKYYKTRDGRKVGPMIADWDGNFSGDGAVIRSSSGSKTTTPQRYKKSGAVHLERNGEALDTLIAEWVEPTPVATPVAAKASNDNGTKFKVGDRVRLVGNVASFQEYGLQGVIKAVFGENSYEVDYSPHKADVCTESVGDIELVSSTATPAIVALIENGTPLPSTTPKVHASQEAATTEAERLALEYPSQTFGVFILADSKIADVVVTEKVVLRAA